MENKTIQQANRDKKATLDSFKVRRDGEGNLLPEFTDTKYGEVGIIPMTYGDSEKWSQMVTGTGEVSADQIAELFRKHVAVPSMADINGDTLRQEFKALAIQELLQAIMAVSGLANDISATVNEDGSATIEAKNS